MDRLIHLIRIRPPLRYADGLDIQRIHGAELENNPKPEAKLIFLQHTPVYTLGRMTKAEHLPLSESDLAARTGAEVVRTDRAGSVTYHAPGQLTAYMLLNLQVWKISLHQHLSKLEEAAIQALRPFGIDGCREAGRTGVWIGGAKICAIGVSARRWVTYHGLSLNSDIDPAPFYEVVPCGLADSAVTSIAKVTGKNVDISDVEKALAAGFSAAYEARVEIGMV